MDVDGSRDISPQISEIYLRVDCHQGSVLLKFGPKTAILEAKRSSLITSGFGETESESERRKFHQSFLTCQYILSCQTSVYEVGLYLKLL
jgi:hypothetical protein